MSDEAKCRTAAATPAAAPPAGTAVRTICQTAVYGPVCTVVSEGQAARPTPIPIFGCYNLAATATPRFGGWTSGFVAPAAGRSADGGFRTMVPIVPVQCWIARTALGWTVTDLAPRDGYGGGYSWLNLTQDRWNPAPHTELNDPRITGCVRVVRACVMQRLR
jgi:hypothetical protein